MCGRRDESLLLDDMVEHAERLIEIGASVRPGTWGCDRGTNERTLYNLLILGEASKRVGPAVQDRFPELPWRDFARTRDRVIHHYEGIDWARVSQIVNEFLPALLPRLIEIRDLLRAEFDAAE